MRSNKRKFIILVIALIVVLIILGKESFYSTKVLLDTQYEELNIEEQKYCREFSIENCPENCSVGSSCYMCENLVCNSNSFYKTKEFYGN